MRDGVGVAGVVAVGLAERRRGSRGLCRRETPRSGRTSVTAAPPARACAGMPRQAAEPGAADDPVEDRLGLVVAGVADGHGRRPAARATSASQSYRARRASASKWPARVAAPVAEVERQAQRPRPGPRRTPHRPATPRPGRRGRGAPPRASAPASGATACRTRSSPTLSLPPDTATTHPGPMPGGGPAGHAAVRTVRGPVGQVGHAGSSVSFRASRSRRRSQGSGHPILREPRGNNGPMRRPELCSTCCGARDAGPALEPEGGARPPVLRCRGCGAGYPVAGGVPRLAGEAYVASFGRQWNRYDVARDEEDEAVFRGQDRGRARRPGGQARARRRLRRRAVRPAGRPARGEGRRRRPQLGRREGRRALRRPARTSRSSRPTCSTCRWPRGRSTWPSRSACCTTAPTRAGRSRRWPRGSSRAAGWRSGSTARTPRPRSGSTPRLRAVTTRLPARVLEPLCAGPGRPRRRPGPEPDAQQGRQLLEPPRLDAPRLRQLRLVRPAVPVAPHGRGAAGLVPPRRVSTTSPCSPRPSRAGSTTGPTATT